MMLVKTFSFRVEYSFKHKDYSILCQNNNLLQKNRKHFERDPVSEIFLIEVLLRVTHSLVGYYWATFFQENAHS